MKIEKSLEEIKSGSPKDVVTKSYISALERILEDSKRAGQVRAEPFLGPDGLYHVSFNIVIAESIAITDSVSAS